MPVRSVEVKRSQLRNFTSSRRRTPSKGGQLDLAQDIRLSLKDWDAFRSGYSPFRFAEIIDCSDLNFPGWFMPNARGAVVPSAQILKPICSHRVRPSFC